MEAVGGKAGPVAGVVSAVFGAWTAAGGSSTPCSARRRGLPTSRRPERPRIREPIFQAPWPALALTAVILVGYWLQVQAGDSEGRAFALVPADLAQGRWVGVITHVPGLAERVPVRFAVRRDQRSARIEREGV